ncbi:MAG: GGDEF domain-containing protein, partial [Anaerolineae bacterium]|nr:GGDEF domain-containing protein [Anaerolineae bacterium]
AESLSNESSSDDRRRPSDTANRCWLAVVDIDHFKRVNDTHGHLIGDEVLILVAQLMRKTFRNADRLYRFGGEEFVVLLRTDQSADAAFVFERLRSTVARFEFPQAGSLTVSIGFTEVTPNDTPSSAFERADQAVYHAKSHGRNQVVDHDNLLRRGEVAATAHTPAAVEFF